MQADTPPGQAVIDARNALPPYLETHACFVGGDDRFPESARCRPGRRQLFAANALGVVRRKCLGLQQPLELLPVWMNVNNDKNEDIRKCTGWTSTAISLNVCLS